MIYTYTPEVFPMRVRTFGCGVPYGAGRLATVVGPMRIPSIYTAGGYTAVFVTVATCWIGAGAIVALFGPETTRTPLESVPDGDSTDA
ncbi:MFS transporter [Amycolatopsis sp. FDAARGOS 1241]|uniref:MFS transporter n=1 Tax=Amycolatopsis sp. FDAARGOS 1241 TaxID=2778070 RepID=UPI00194ECDE0|nr:MFS transporter [Amycolatopsis sp. FDAARGOS 1241]QRP50309.1 MFS transporter [Amycolatopsis sp. FDAARGOS 1241]